MGAVKDQLPTSYAPVLPQHQHLNDSSGSKSSQTSFSEGTDEKTASTLPFTRDPHLRPSANGAGYSYDGGDHDRKTKKRRKWMAIGGFVGVLVVGAVVGGVVGSLTRHHQEEEAAVSPLHYTSSGVAASMTFLSIATATAGTTTAAAAAAPSPTVTASIAADPMRRLVVFGASYCDNGHPRASVYQASLKPPPYFEGRESNGIVWDEYLANVIGSNGKTTELVNYAYAGAMVNNNITVPVPEVPDTFAQINSYSNDLSTGTLASQPAGGKTLIAIWVGLNPIMALWNQATNTGKKALTTSSVQSSNSKITATSASLLSQVSHLLQASSQETSILLLPLPPTVILPYAQYWSKGNSDYLSLFANLTTTFNKQLAAGATQQATSRLFMFDIPGFYKAMLANPEEVAGVSNTTSSCLQGGEECNDVGTRLWWDSIHMTTKGHAAVARALIPTVDAFWSS